jgi:hypothetical protein
MNEHPTTPPDIIGANGAAWLIDVDAAMRKAPPVQ